MILQGYAVMDDGTGELQKYFCGQRGPRIYKSKDRAMKVRDCKWSSPNPKGKYVLVAVYAVPLTEESE